VRLRRKTYRYELMFQKMVSLSRRLFFSCRKSFISFWFF